MTAPEPGPLDDTRTSLSRAFWLNFAAPQGLLAMAQALFVAWFGTALTPASLPLVTTVLAAQIFHFVWAALGVFRASERDLAEAGTMVRHVGALAGIVGVLWIAALNGFGLWIVAVREPEPEENFAERMDREHASRYRLTITSARRIISLEGDIALGTSKAFARLLAENPNLRGVELASPGGNIYEARGIARQIRAAGLATHVVGDCTSACTMLLAGGVRRTAGPGARIGFHKYRIDADYDVPFANTAAEQERDRAAFLSYGVTPAFVKRMHDAAADTMWFPSISTLRQANVLTHNIARPTHPPARTPTTQQTR